MTDTTPQKTPQTQLQSLPPDTVPVIRHTSQTDYRTGDLKSCRLAILADLGRYMKVPFNNLVKSIGAMPSERDLQRTRHHLIDNKIIDDMNGLRWKKFSSPSLSRTREDKTFDPLGDIICEILKQVQGHTLKFEARPNGTPLSSRDNTSRPDGYLIRESEIPDHHWWDIAVPFEFKKVQDEKGTRDDEQKIIWSLHNIMREDPCRRFAFGITMEDTKFRLWLSNRALLAVSEYIDFFEDIDRVITLFYAIGSASSSTGMKKLGWDPTIERFLDEKKQTQYKFRIGGQLFTTTKELATYGADSMVGRGTRVYKATDANGNAVAIKDSWREATRQSEGDILEGILASCREKLTAEEMVDAEKHFVRIRFSKHVEIDHEQDKTLDPMAGEGGSWIWVKINLEPVLSKKRFSTSMGDVPDVGSSTFLPTQVIGGTNEKKSIPYRLHTRTVFDDVGSAVKDLTSLVDILRCLSGGLKALRYLHKAGWIHRDFSVGNVIWISYDNGGIGKLSDFEYAKKVDSDMLHDDVRTGTVHFMAVEVDAQRYLFNPSPQLLSDGESSDDATPLPLPPFRMNFLHDIESVWWATVWFFFSHTDVRSTTPDNPDNSFDMHAQWDQFRAAFPGKVGQSSRHNFFTKLEELPIACHVLSQACRKVIRNSIPNFAQSLIASHQKAEKNHPSQSVVVTPSLLQHVHDKASQYLNRAEERANGIQLRPLPDLLDQKRRRPEHESSPTPKSRKTQRLV